MQFLNKTFLYYLIGILTNLLKILLTSSQLVSLFFEFFFFSFQEKELGIFWGENGVFFSVDWTNFFLKFWKFFVEFLVSQNEVFKNI